MDTHVWRITKALGWVPPRSTREQAYLHLNARVPAPLKCARAGLRVSLPAHGPPTASCCGERAPPCISQTRPWRSKQAPPLLPIVRMQAPSLCGVVTARRRRRYALHVLLVEHGKRCPRCAKIPGRPRKEPVGACPLPRAHMRPAEQPAGKACSASTLQKASDGRPGKPARTAGRGKRKAHS